MQIFIHHYENSKIAEVISDNIIIERVQDALDLMANADYQSARMIILNEKNISPEFFNLRTGLAGEILQKFVNYQVKLAIVGEFTKYNSNSLKSFIIECNRGSHFFFVDNIEAAIENLINCIRIQ